MSKTLCFLLLFGCLASTAVPATILQGSEHVTVELISEVLSIKPGRTFSVGVFFVLETGWHTYWLNPGDSGLPAVITWKLPPGFSPGEIQWPYPSRLGSESIVNFGYEGEVLLITSIEVSPTVKAGETLTIEADMEWLVCKEECLPGRAVLSLSLPVANKEPLLDPNWKNKFEDTRKKMPVALQDWEAHAVIDNNQILLRVFSSSGPKNESRHLEFFPEQPELLNYSAPQLFETTDNGYLIQARLSALARKIPPKLEGVLVSDQSWSRGRETKALRIVVPLAQQNKDIKSQKEVSR
jgi:thiol:disulfide interchange protein DsbD